MYVCVRVCVCVYEYLSHESRFHGRVGPNVRRPSTCATRPRTPSHGRRSGERRSSRRTRIKEPRDETNQTGHCGGRRVSRSSQPIPISMPLRRVCIHRGPRRSRQIQPPSCPLRASASRLIDLFPCVTPCKHNAFFLLHSITCTTSFFFSFLGSQDMG